MPLSDHEQRLLEQMERALLAEDPKFADTLRKTRRPNMDRTRIAVGAIAILVGLGILISGVAVSVPLLGLLGFVVMLAGSFVVWKAINRPAAMGGGPKPPDVDESPTRKPHPSSRRSQGFMDRMEERWRRRRDRY